MNESIKDVLYRSLLEEPCPIQTKLYGGIPSGGGFRSNTEYEVGAQRAAEAAHCILGSLGKRVGRDLGWKSVYRFEMGHIREELGIIKYVMKEYNRSLYNDRLLTGNTLSGARTVESIRKVAPKLKKLAQMNLRAWNQQKGVPSDIKDTGQQTYQFLIVLSDVLLDSVRVYPARVTNAYKDTKLRNQVSKLSSAVRSMEQEEKRRRQEDAKEIEQTQIKSIMSLLGL